jgi:hypothetical protein
MRYLKRFDEGSLTSTLTTEMLGELRDFCRDYLAYLIDEGFTVQVVPTFYGTECDVFIFKEVKEPFTGIVISQWSSIKDQIIPFLYMLNKHYTIVDADDDHYNRSAQRFFTIQPSEIDSFINDTVDDFKLRKLRIRVNFKDKSITEAKEDWRRNFSDDELQEVCDTFLPYLYDEGFVVQTTVPTYFMFKKNIITLWKEEESSKGLEIVPFYWHEIKDRFLPLFDYLNKNYPLGKVRLVHYYNPWERKENKKEVVFKSDGDKESWSGHPFSKFEEIMSRDAAYRRPMKIGEIIIEVQNLDEL